MYELIKTKPVFFPDPKKHGISMTADCKDFIEKCLKKHPDERLGSNGDINEILAHPWFSDVDMTALLSRQIKPEFIPKLSNDVMDVSNFDKVFTSDEAAHSVVPVTLQRKIAKQNDKFKGFDS